MSSLRLVWSLGTKHYCFSYWVSMWKGCLGIQPMNKIERCDHGSCPCTLLMVMVILQFTENWSLNSKLKSIGITETIGMNTSFVSRITLIICGREVAWQLWEFQCTTLDCWVFCEAWWASQILVETCNGEHQIAQESSGSWLNSKLSNDLCSWNSRNLFQFISSIVSLLLEVEASKNISHTSIHL